MSIKRFHVSMAKIFEYHKMSNKLNPIIECECGCGNFKMLFDNRGRHFEYLEGHKTGQIRKGRKLSLSHRQKISNWAKTVIRTDGWKRKIGDAHRGKKRHWKSGKPPNLGKKFSIETKEKIRLSRLKQIIPIKDTKPEIMIQIALNLEGIKFEKHKLLIGQPDIFIEPNLCIFIDGCYWHGCKECFPDLIVNKRIFQTIFTDFEIVQKLNELGYNVIRIKEHLIIDKKTNSIENIISLIKNTIRIVKQ